MTSIQSDMKYSRKSQKRDTTDIGVFYTLTQMVFVSGPRLAQNTRVKAQVSIPEFFLLQNTTEILPWAFFSYTRICW